MNWSQRYASESLARAAIVAEAQTWVGTPWAHAHDRKGGGVDCAMLILRVYADVGLIENFDPRPYPPQWFQHQEHGRFLEIVERCGGHPLESGQPGDIAMFKFGKQAAHGAIIVDDHTMIHAYRPARRVIADTRRSMPGHFAGYWSLF